MADSPPRPRVFLDVSIGSEAAGRIVIELFIDQTPKTCENFRSLCTSAKSSLSYKNVPFHRIIEDFMIQGGDIQKADGTGSISIYGEQFDDENLNWHDIDAPGLVCMANSGKNTNGSQFFITLTECPHLNGIHTVFGRVVSGGEVTERMAAVAVDREDKPKTRVFISHCGELERRSKRSGLVQRVTSKTDKAEDSEDHRGRGKRRRSESSLADPVRESEKARRTEKHDRDRRRRHRSHSRTRRDSRDRSQDKRGHGRRNDDEPRSNGADKSQSLAHRRRSDVWQDHTLRGRTRRRSESPNGTRNEAVFDDSDHENGDADGHRDRRHHRSPSPSRVGRKAEDDGEEVGLRRRRSLPNHYREWEKRERQHGGHRDNSDRRSRGRLRDGEEDQMMAAEFERDGMRHRYDDVEDQSGRLGGPSYEDDMDDGAIRYKGRGAMRYREKRRW